MNSTTQIALAKFLEKNPPEAIDPGVYEVDEIVTLHVLGIVNKSEPGAYTPTVKTPWLLTMALFLEKMGMMRDHCITALTEAMTQALQANTIIADSVSERIKDVEIAMGHARRITENLPKQIRSGPTNIDVEVNELEPANVP